MGRICTNFNNLMLEEMNYIEKDKKYPIVITISFFNKRYVGHVVLDIGLYINNNTICAGYDKHRKKLSFYGGISITDWHKTGKEVTLGEWNHISHNRNILEICNTLEIGYHHPRSKGLIKDDKQNCMCL